MDSEDNARFVPPVEPFPAARLNVPDPLHVPRSTTTRVWIGIAWVLGALLLPVIAYVVYIVILLLAAEHP